MSTLCIALVLFAAQPVEGINPHVQTNTAISQDSATLADQPISAVPVRKGKELEEATHGALRRWVHVDKTNAKSAAREFIEVFDELKRDTSLARSTRRELGSQVRGRLIHLAELIQRSKGENRGNHSPPNLGNAPDNAKFLGQMGGGFNQSGGLGNQSRRGQRGGSGGNARNNSPQDAGDDLVDLIQKTISPSSWDINGGPGSIQYWRPGHALVVRASEDVHEQIGGALGQLQRGQ